MNSVSLLFLLLIWYMEVSKSGKIYIYMLLPWYLEWTWEHRRSERFWDVTPVQSVWKIITFSSLLFILIPLSLTLVLAG